MVAVGQDAIYSLFYSETNDETFTDDEVKLRKIDLENEDLVTLTTENNYRIVEQGSLNKYKKVENVTYKVGLTKLFSSNGNVAGKKKIMGVTFYILSDVAGDGAVEVDSRGAKFIYKKLDRVT